MAFFRKKKKKKNEDSEDKKPVKKKKKEGEDEVKKRKKVEKPWGKKERLFVFAILVVTVGTSSVLALSSREWKLPGLPKLSMPKLNFFGEEKYVIEGNLKEKERKEKIVDKFMEFSKDSAGILGLYVYKLETDFSFGVNEREAFEPASLNKLPVMIALYKESEEQGFNLDEEYVLQNEDKISGSGSLESESEGTKVTYRDLLRYMGKESDNTAFNILKNTLGEEKINNVIAEIGMYDTDIFSEEQSTTPKNIGLLFEKLWNDELLLKEDKEELFSFLTDTVYEEWISAGIPDEIEVAHKYGREQGVVNDAGIVFTDEAYVIVLMGKGIVERKADEFYPEMSRFIYNLQVE